MEELWKPVTVEKFEKLYEVSNMGNIRNYKKIIVRPYKAGKYMVINLQHKGVERYMVHRLVACAFVSDPDDDPNKNIVNHKDGDKYNNKASNLEWVTTKENVAHSRNVLKQRKTNKKIVSIDDKGIEKEYESIISAASELGIRRQYITDCLRGTRSQIKNLSWKYLNSNHNMQDADLKQMTEISDYPGYYINKKGQIYGISKKQFLTENMSDGYPKVLLYKNAIPKSFYIHVLVAKTFIPNPENKPVVNHKDHNIKNHDVTNLEWVTHSENSMKYQQYKKSLVLNHDEKSSDGSVENAEVQVQSNDTDNPEPSSC